MALIYRAIFQVDDHNLVSLCRQQFADWVGEKYVGAVLPDEGETAVAEGVRVRADSATGDSGSIAQFAIYEERVSERWTTTLTATATRASAQRSIWVDVERVAENPYARFEVAAPRVVRSLIQSATNPRRGPTRLTVEPRAYRPGEIDQLLRLLTSQDRDIPIVVLTMNPSGSGEDWTDRSALTARGLAGITSVVMLPPDAEERFNGLVGRDHGVWGGALRVYLPGFDPQAGQPWRHRYVQAHLLDRNRGARRRHAGRLVAPYAANMRAPTEYGSLRPMLRSARAAQGEEIGELIDEVDRENRDLKDQIRLLEEANLDLAANLEEAEGANNRLRATLALSGAQTRGEREALATVPVNVSDCIEAVALAREHLKNLAIPEGADVDIETLDEAIESRAWAEKIWHALRALDAYASDMSVPGGFWEWCKDGSHPLVWPASKKKLAMRESESTSGRRSYRAARTFTVDPQLEPLGRLMMEAHIKIAEGGGDNAPRVYFYDDSKGTTRKVHIGYIGPHRHVPNDSG